MTNQKKNSNLEIERKFLVKSERFKNYSDKEERIVQGFLNTNPERTVRIRIKGNKGYITVKGKSNETGLSRFEWEKEISVAEADSLLKIAEPGIIEKLRYEVKSEKHTFEIDVFAGDNTGLIIAEVELQSEDEVFNKPDWLGAEVTGIAKYYNSQLSKNPFKLW
ncbi:CYTH domain-containing protein [Cellulophaga tyrosinoxydans]|uniref:CYTH domain-containing protein n=1 Tax=Cellulophaga tyrosinoxydans TaxID=504486 RepID=A0A1W1Z238_9FLAO|nr:CYTH domain-containing protein [Cellulophaga tyrosinoxydans]SMC42141.1 CYTH domain-containing protein [Cellulophaga tyrosinoxydans]